jgi:hypothetical protein
VSEIPAARVCPDRPDQLLTARHGPLPRPPSKPEQRGACAKPSFRGERWIAAFHRITTLGSRQHFDPSATMRAAHHQVFPAPPSTHDKETALHPTISYRLATARAAELRSQAQRDALARHARTHKPEHAAPRLAAAGRRLLTSLRPRGT